MSVPSVAIAKDRLKNLLMSDRIQCTQDMTERLSKDLYQVIAKYMELDPEKVTIEITRNDIHIKYDAADPWSGSWSGGHGRYFPD